MLSKRTTVLSVIGLAALATWLKVKRQPHLRFGNAGLPDEEEDRLAEIIQRARPALERATELA